MITRLIVTILLSLLFGLIYYIVSKKIKKYEKILFTLNSKNFQDRYIPILKLYIATGIGFIWIAVWLSIMDKNIESLIENPNIEMSFGSLIGFYTIVFISRISYFSSRNTKEEPLIRLSSIFNGFSILSVIALADLSFKTEIFEFLKIYCFKYFYMGISMSEIVYFEFFIIILPFFYALMSEFFISLFLKAEKFQSKHRL